MILIGVYVFIIFYKLNTFEIHDFIIKRKKKKNSYKKYVKKVTEYIKGKG